MKTLGFTFFKSAISSLFLRTFEASLRALFDEASSYFTIEGTKVIKNLGDYFLFISI